MIRVKNSKDFKKAMAAIGSKIEQKMATQVNKKLAIDSFSQLVFVSPVDKGYLRHNWDIEVDGAPPEVSEPKAEKGKKYARPRRPSTKEVKYNSIIDIYNNTSYAKHVEEGTEKMEAQPMVGIVKVSINHQAEYLCKTFGIEEIDD